VLFLFVVYSFFCVCVSVLFFFFYFFFLFCFFFFYLFCVVLVFGDSYSLCTRRSPNVPVLSLFCLALMAWGPSRILPSFLLLIRIRRRTEGDVLRCMRARRLSLGFTRSSRRFSAAVVCGFSKTSLLYFLSHLLTSWKRGLFPAMSAALCQLVSPFVSFLPLVQGCSLPPSLLPVRACVRTSAFF